MSVLRLWLHPDCDRLIRRGLAHLACGNCQEIHRATKNVTAGDPASRGSSTSAPRAPEHAPEVAGSGLSEVDSASPAPGSQGRTTPAVTTQHRATKGATK